MTASDAVVRVFAATDALTDAAAQFVVRAAAAAILERGTFRIAFAGGSTPRDLYQRLSAPDLASGVDWRRWQVYFGDERCVPPDHEASNYRMAKIALFDRVPIPVENVHRIHGEVESRLAAERYVPELGDSPLDLVLLGMGNDGHTASLFPGTSALDSEPRRVIATKSPVAPHDRVTLTLRALNEARAVLFLVSGESKAAQLAAVVSELASDTPTLPAAKVRPANGTVQWFVDAAAARAVPGLERTP